MSDHAPVEKAHAVPASAAAANRLQAKAHELAHAALSLGATAIRITLRRDQVARSERSAAGILERRRSFREYEAMVYKGDRLTQICSTDLSSEGVAATMSSALKMLDQLPQALFLRAAQPQRLQLPPGPFNALRLSDPAMASPKLARCTSRLQALPSMPASVEENSSAIAISDGIQHGGFTHTMVKIRAQVDQRLQRSWTARHLSDLPDIEQISANLIEDQQLLLAPSATVQAEPVSLLVAPVPASQLIDALVRTAPSGALPQRLSVIADPWLPGGIASMPFTEDGRPTRPEPLIQGGQRRPTLHPGHAPSPGNLRVGLGGRSLARMMAETRSGVVVTGWLTDPRDLVHGPAPLSLVGRKIHNGSPAGPLVGAQLKLSLQALFTKLVRVGADPWTLGSARSPSLAFDPVKVHAAP